jgi:hypothetical protein
LLRSLAALFLSVSAAALVDAQALEIWDIQGDGMSSPYQGQLVTTRDNVVTAIGADLFFIQTPDTRSDGDPLTSDGILVDLGRTPTVSVGDLVDVTGTVGESFGSTEISGNPTVSVVATGHGPPSVVDFDSQTPTSFLPWPETELERFEGMVVRIRVGMVTAPSDRFGEACVSAGGRRLYREPGILYPGRSGLAVWDGNPEGFELDPMGLGGDGVDLAAGTNFRAVGVLAYAFGAYQLWPTVFEVIEAAELPVPVPAPSPGEVTIGSQNLDRLGDPGDDVPYATRLAKLSRQVREVLGSPHVLAVEEVMDLGTLEDLTDRMAADDPAVLYQAYLVEGNDFGGIDVGFLVRDPARVLDLVQVGADARFTWDGSLLFDRPPLVLEAEFSGPSGSFEATLVAVHLRSLGGIDDPDDGERVRQKRHEQSGWLADWIQQRQTADPVKPLIVLGDFNAFEFSDGYVDVMGQVTGEPDPDGALLAAGEDVDPPLANWLLRLPASDRYSFVFGCSAEALDHVVTNQAATAWVRSVAYSRGNADAPNALELDANTAARSSDHDGLVLYLGPRVRRDAGPRKVPVSGGSGGKLLAVSY